MNCPIEYLSGTSDADMVEETFRAVQGRECLMKDACNAAECLKCPFFPPSLLANLLSIEHRMLKARKINHSVDQPVGV